MEYLLSFINLTFETGDEEKAITEWLSAMDTALEERHFADANKLFRAISSFHLSPRAQAQASLSKAELHVAQGQNQAAIEAYRFSIATFRRFGDENAEALASNSLALLLQEMGHYDQAVFHYRVAAKLCRRAGDHEALGEVLSNLGSLADAQRNWAKALPYYKQATKAFSYAEANQKLAGVYNNLGVAHELLGNLEDAETWYQRCVDLLDEIGESYSEKGWRILINLAELAANRGDEAQMDNCHCWAFEIADVLDSNYLRALTWNNKGALVDHQGDKREAANCYQEALNSLSHDGDYTLQALILNNLGAALSDLEDYVQAEMCYEESLAISREFSDLSGEARTLNNLAVLYETLERTDEAIALYQQAADLFADLDDVRHEITTLINIASLAWRTGRDKFGREYFLRAWPLARGETFHNELAKLYQSHGDWASMRKETYQLAKKWYERALTVCTDSSMIGELNQRLNWLREQLTGH